MEFIYLIKEEWLYHLTNIAILIIFSFYGSYRTIKRKIDLEIFRETEKQKKKLTDKSKKIIAKEEKKSFLKEFLKSFFALFVVYFIYIIYRSGIFL